MVKRLTLKEQRKIVRDLPKSRLMAVKKHCNSCEMRGEGMVDIIKSVGIVLGPIAKEFGPTILKEIVAPFVVGKIKKRMDKSGQGLRLAGQRGQGHCKGKRM